MHRTLPSLAVRGVVVVALLGCAEQGRQGVSGVWKADVLVPGASTILTLVQRGDTVTGTGSYSIEAGRSGTLIVTGAYVAPRVALLLTYDFGQIARYTAAVQDGTHMVGVAAFSVGPVDSLVFTRQ